MKKSRFQKYAVAAVALLFIGSMAGALLYSTGAQKEEELPAEHILTQLSDMQKQLILSRGYIIFDAEIPSPCYLECAAAKRGLEQAVSAFNPAIYLVEENVQSAGFDVPVLMKSFKDEKNLAAFNQTEIEDFVCENSAFRLDYCTIRKIQFGELNETNSTRESLNETGN